MPRVLFLRAGISAALVLIFSSSLLQADELMPGFLEASEFQEQHRWETTDDGIRVYVMAPREFRDMPRQLVIYATPNGSTIEQTLGCRVPSVQPHVDWKFDIQHVAAQVRHYRSLRVDRDVVLAVVQAPKLSWPVFRKEFTTAPKRILDLVARLQADVKATDVTLSCHSGGGAFLWSWMNAQAELSAAARRIVFLDANYSYSDEDHHGDKLIRWLRSDAENHLVVVAYDDREIMLNGRKVIEPNGGTLRATERMKARFEKDFMPIELQQLDFKKTAFLEGQATFLVHQNTENKVLHTALVGEMNGLVHSLVPGTLSQDSDNLLGVPRRYEQWISAKPLADPAKSTATINNKAESKRLSLPNRAIDARGGSVLASEWMTADLTQREQLIETEILSGNIPEMSRRLVPVQISSPVSSEARKHEATIFVLSDYLAVGSDDDFVRVPLTPATAVRIADKLDCLLITERISDQVHSAAQIRLDPRPMTKDRESMATFLEHSRLVDQHLAKWKQSNPWPQHPLISGVKKDVVISKRLSERTGKVAIYGWHYPNGTPIQPLYPGHAASYVDYSHGIRLVDSQMLVDGMPQNVRTVLSDSQLFTLLSSEGPMDYDGIVSGTTNPK